jgi:signal transduction histidine kinase/ActR/RegA family two-component response regulator
VNSLKAVECPLGEAGSTSCLTVIRSPRAGGQKEACAQIAKGCNFSFLKVSPQMNLLRRSTSFGYLLACIGTVAVAAFRLAIGDLAGDQIWLLPFLLSVMIAARYGGFGPGVLATVLGAIASVLLFVKERQLGFLGNASDKVRLGVFLFMGTLTSYLWTALLSARARAEVNALKALGKQQELELADQHKNDFLATLAHEIRNPLAAIQNGLSLLRLADLPDSLHLSTCAMERQLSVITRLTSDLFDLSSISRGKLRLKTEPIDLIGLVMSAVDTMRPALESRKHTLEIDLPEQAVIVMGDAARLTQVFVNLLANAIKYTEDGGKIRIAGALDAGNAVMRVVDDGVGIPAEHLGRLFQLGEQVETNIERSDGGLGIGLAVVRRLIEMHGGSVKAFSDGPGHGCEFVVRLPIAKTIALAGGLAGVTEQHDLSREDGNPCCQFKSGVARIVVVDDHGSIAETCAAILRDRGFEAEFATDSNAAIQVINDFNPDIVLMDINMPRMNGFELARRIKSTEQRKNVAFLAITGGDVEREASRCAEAGFAGCFGKPLKIEDVCHMAAELTKDFRPSTDPAAILKDSLS